MTPDLVIRSLTAGRPAAAPTAAELGDRAAHVAELAGKTLDAVAGLSRVQDADGAGLVMRRLGEALESLEWAYTAATLLSLLDAVPARGTLDVGPDLDRLTFTAST